MQLYPSWERKVFRLKALVLNISYFDVSQLELGTASFIEAASTSSRREAFCGIISLHC